ncbi:MAG: PAS domain S-box protein [Desulfatiglandales bacterium]
MPNARGENRLLAITKTPKLDKYGNVEYIVCVGRDITETRQADIKLRESEEKFRFIAEKMADIVWTVDLRLNTTYVSPSIEKVLGFTPEERKQQSLEDMLTTESFQRVITEFSKALQHEDEGDVEPDRSVTIEVEYYHKDGSTLWMENSMKPMRDHHADFIGIYGVSRDISERKQAAERLKESEWKLRTIVEHSRRSEQRFRDLFDAISDVIYTQDLEGRFLSLNPAMCKLFGYDEEELIGKQASDYMKPELAALFESEYLEKIKKEGHHEGTSLYFAKGGKKIYLEYRSSMVYPEDGEPYISGTGRDVTAKILSEREVKKLQAHLAQVQKMESIGTLAGGIAHNFNNVLMGIQGCASLMMMDKGPSHPDYEHLKGIEEYVRSAADLTRDLLGFAMGGKYEVKPTDLNTLINHENRMFGRTKKEIRIHGKYEKDLWTVEVDQGRIRQVFLNLYVNAWQAMPDGGDLYIQTKNVTLDHGYIKPFEITPGRYVKISVTDTGIGMDDAIREKIFDPFFSTKKMDQGSGLGLASVYGIIKNHGGFIQVSSAEGYGTTFDIFLPAPMIG